MRYRDFLDLGYRPRESDVVCRFHLEPGDLPLEEAAGAVAAESSIGTWTELRTLKPYMVELRARVFEMEGQAISVAYPLELFEPGNLSNLLSSVAGNIFGMSAISRLKLLDIMLPEALLRSYPGPRYGIEGVRNLLGIRGRPLVGTIIKPKLGLNVQDHARVAYEAWRGGCDIVKDDENLADQGFNPFEDRVIETLEMRDRAEEETGERKAYLVNITAETGEMLRRAEYVEDHGGRYVMIDILTTGFAALQTLRKADLKLALHGHRAGHAAFTRPRRHGIAMRVIAKLARFAGIDQLHVGTAVGKMAEPRERVLENVEALKTPMGRLKPALPVASGGLHPGLVPELLKIFGPDVIIQAGGGVHGHPGGTEAGARAMRQAVEAALEGIPLKEYAKGRPELAAALERWSRP
ncbi:MAG: ribulose 1,5-bisphosphate carboxylase [Candidatus Bathyarchaeota archaeon B23]|nr:MAG: ribulose 1,5-bisphosphate carboxylase [Candidatus Bathyarchaeota archaeon B23]